MSASQLPALQEPAPSMAMNHNSPHVLTSWKEIASYMGKGVRTVQRWEAELDFPVRRPGADKRIVVAFPLELDEWLKRGPKPKLNGSRDHLRIMQMKNLVEKMHRHASAMQANTMTLVVQLKQSEAICRRFRERNSTALLKPDRFSQSS